ncbi:molybdenum cofactor biosynthesis protein MoaE [Alteromonas sp. ASW11-19]|uniref:Molybdopterin synthase catalytic subunit n=1 Tax=Alteromonas salexigens TaxID=2982530 RepID=A0ABT2VR65_9ALTE|nr:molybdenum cofactor biosynthesis protein MoaE [Alteromonas salexigens]MCU7555817.1 molybdenum cofactor biosynthesis protein MoaE [Alteromonas salexigens]
MFASVTTSPLNAPTCYETFTAQLPAGETGAIVTFTGRVRDFNDTGALDGIELEHYPGMTENAMAKLLDEARERFSLIDAGVVHRVGHIANNEDIVWVGCAAMRRQAAFDAAAFIMDTLKQAVPLWKKEFATNGEGAWVKPKASDTQAAMQWLKSDDKEAQSE